VNDKEMKWAKLLVEKNKRIKSMSEEISNLENLLALDDNSKNLVERCNLLAKELKKYKDLYEGQYIKNKILVDNKRKYYYKRHYGSAVSMPKHLHKG
jgi:hypothetical protein